MNSDEFRKAAHSAIDESKSLAFLQCPQLIESSHRLLRHHTRPPCRLQCRPRLSPEITSAGTAPRRREVEGHPEGHRVQDNARVDALVRSEPRNGCNVLVNKTHGIIRQSPNFMAFYPASATYPSMLGELYSAAFTAPAFNWLCSPAVTELETVVLDWMARLMNLPTCFLSEGEGGGVIQGSASEAVVTVMVAARERYLNNACGGLEGEEREKRKAEVRSRLVALGSEQSHSSAAKAAIIAGLRYKSIPCRMEDDLALTGAGLQKMLGECRQQGLEPFFLDTTLGTTATCAIDRFKEIKEVAKDWPEMWIHVDAAYAGAALVCEEYQHLTEPFEAFDSFDMNMHKWLLTNFDARYVSIIISSTFAARSNIFTQVASTSNAAATSPTPSPSPLHTFGTSSLSLASSLTTGTGKSLSVAASARSRSGSCCALTASWG